MGAGIRCRHEVADMARCDVPSAGSFPYHPTRGKFAVPMQLGKVVPVSSFRKPYVPARGVSNIELFYDLVFVYCISVVTGVMYLYGFFDVETYAL